MHGHARRRAAEQAENSSRRTAAGLNRPSGSRFFCQKRFTAPGMWPATGSRVSCRSGVAIRRTRIDERDRRVARGCARRRAHPRWRPGAGAGRSCPRAARAPPWSRGGPPSPLRRSRRRGARRARGPSQRSIHHRRTRIAAARVVVDHDLRAGRHAALRSCAARTRRASGSGWRPLAAGLGTGEVVVQVQEVRAGDVPLGDRRGAPRRASARSWRTSNDDPARIVQVLGELLRRHQDLFHVSSRIRLPRPLPCAPRASR